MSQDNSALEIKKNYLKDKLLVINGSNFDKNLNANIIDPYLESNIYYKKFIPFR